MDDFSQLTNKDILPQLTQPTADFLPLTNVDILPVDSGAIINSKVEAISGLFAEQLQTDENLQNDLALEAVKKLNVDKTVLTYKQQQIDISAEVEAFLTFQRSEKTKSLYNFFWAFLQVSRFRWFGHPYAKSSKRGYLATCATCATCALLF